MSENGSVKKKGLSWNLIAILVVTIVPIAGAYISYFTGIGVSETTVNEGMLIKADPAKSLQDLLENASGETPSFDRNYKWRMLIPITDQCNEQCQKNLYTSRQVHIRLGEKAGRVERYAVNLGGVQGQKILDEIAEEHPMLKVFTVTKRQWDNWMDDTNVPENMDEKPYYILVDQVGFAMMFYTVEHEGNQLLKDIKRILRYSVDK